MKYFIKLYIIILFSINLTALSSDIIIPESFKSNQLIQNNTIDTNQNIDTTESDIIIPDSLKKNQNQIIYSSTSNEEAPITNSSSLQSDIIIPPSFSSHKNQTETIVSTTDTKEVDTTLSTFDPTINPISATTIQEHKNSWKKEIIKAEVQEEQPKITKPLVEEIDNDTDYPLEDYSGVYKFTKGTNSLSGQIKTFTDGLLVIEKLDENDFGFYYVIQTDNLAPTDRFGIFHYHKDRFFLKFIDDPIHRDNVKIKKSTYSLETDIWDDKGEHAIQWELGSEADIDMLSSRLKKSFKQTQNDYKQIVKDRFTH